MQQAVGRRGVRLAAIARRRISLPEGARMEMFVADTSHWAETIHALKPAAVICALGTTWKKAGEVESEYRAVDEGLVLHVARAAKEAGASQFIVVSSAGAERSSRHLYLRTKAEMEEHLAKLRFHRLDILRPGLLKGRRIDDPRPLERLMVLASPLVDLFLWGRHAAFRSIADRKLAQIILKLLDARVQGKFVHDRTAMMRLLGKG